MPMKNSLGAYGNPGMNERKTTVLENLKQTFKCIFRGLNVDDCSASDPTTENTKDQAIASITNVSDLPWQKQSALQARRAKEN